MNVFIVSPGRTATTALSHAFDQLPGYTSAHESRVQCVGDARIAFPENHIECDNRLAWFLPRLTERYGASGLLVVVRRSPEAIAASYSKRWYKVNLAKAYGQGILLRDLSDRAPEVTLDLVTNIYEHLDHFRQFWRHSAEIDLDTPEVGIHAALVAMGAESYTNDVVQRLSVTKVNENTMSWRLRGSIVKYAIENLYWDVRQCLRS